MDDAVKVVTCGSGDGNEIIITILCDYAICNMTALTIKTRKEVHS
jgi:hypothetical protein